MFNQMHVNVDDVQFEYSRNGHFITSTVHRPDGVSYSQWTEFWAFEDQQDEIERLENELNDLEKKHEAETVVLKDEIADLKVELEKAENEIDNLEEEIDSLERENDKLEKRIAELVEELNNSQGRL